MRRLKSVKMSIPIGFINKCNTLIIKTQVILFKIRVCAHPKVYLNEWNESNKN